jgi:hypothetical protein
MCNALKRKKTQNVKWNHFPMRFMSSKMCNLQDQSHKISMCFCSVEIEKKNEFFFLIPKHAAVKKNVLPNFRSSQSFFFRKKHKKREIYFIYDIFLTLKKIFLQNDKFFQKNFFTAPFGSLTRIYYQKIKKSY